jgi:hypothetical protein
MEWKCHAIYGKDATSERMMTRDCGSSVGLPYRVLALSWRCSSPWSSKRQRRPCPVPAALSHGVSVRPVMYGGLG